MITKIRSSLTLKIFLGTFFILLFACSVTYGFIAYVIPHSFSTNLYQELEVYFEEMISDFDQATYEDSEVLLQDFALKHDARISIYDEAGQLKKDINSSFSDDNSDEFDNTSKALCFSIAFTDSPELYEIVIQGNTKSVNRITEIIGKIWYWVLICVLIISSLTAFIYAHFITKPIVKASRISKKIADMDFNWRYDEKRTDEIGMLEHNINVLSDKLETALTKLQDANAKLQNDIESEKEQEQQMRQFFSAVSHELKTPITIIKGQLCGMIDGVGSYADRDKYLARSLVVANRMEKMVQELLMVARLDQNDASYNPTQINLSKLTQECVDDYIDLFEQKEQNIQIDIASDLWTIGDAKLLQKTICNVLSNAAFYSPNNETISITLKEESNRLHIIVLNQGAHIHEEALPHVFDAFYRVDASRNRETGGTGLGLYLVKKIIDKHGGECKITNTENGVSTELILKKL